jgi:hypothetical protein
VTDGAKINSSPLQDKPTHIRYLIQLLCQLTQSISEQAANLGRRNDTPSSFFDHQNALKGEMTQGDDQIFAIFGPSRTVQIQASGNESTQ